ncbi:MAG: hypothetical protein AAGB00_12200, partial [Planctomycetota bacterium]
LLDRVLRPLRLELINAGGGLALGRVGAGAERAKTYAVADLARGDAASLAETVSMLLPDLRARVAADGADGLRVNGPASAHMEVAVLCERLRKARGLKARSRYPAELLRVEPALAALDSRLARRTTFSFVTYTPLAEVITYWRRASGLALVVDWGALAGAELHPDTPIACSVVDRPWREALDSVLGGVGLVWIAVDGRTLQITTAADRRATIEFYPVATEADARELERVAIELPEAETHYDSASGSLIIRATAGGHRAVWAQVRGGSE